MCQSCCERPEKMKGKPEECSAEQIRECHGDAKEHPCKEEKRNPDRKHFDNGVGCHDSYFTVPHDETN